jgi:hypothetical protein
LLSIPNAGTFAAISSTVSRSILNPTMHRTLAALALATVSGLVDQLSDHPAAKMTAEEILERARRLRSETVGIERYDGSSYDLC